MFNLLFLETGGQFIELHHKKTHVSHAGSSYGRGTIGPSVEDSSSP